MGLTCTLTLWEGTWWRRCVAPSSTKCCITHLDWGGSAAVAAWMLFVTLFVYAAIGPFHSQLQCRSKASPCRHGTHYLVPYMNNPKCDAWCLLCCWFAICIECTWCMRQKASSSDLVLYSHIATIIKLYWESWSFHVEINMFSDVPLNPNWLDRINNLTLCLSICIMNKQLCSCKGVQSQYLGWEWITGLSNFAPVICTIVYPCGVVRKPLHASSQKHHECGCAPYSTSPRPLFSCVQSSSPLNTGLRYQQALTCQPIQIHVMYVILCHLPTTHQAHCTAPLDQCNVDALVWRESSSTIKDCGHKVKFCLPVTQQPLCL